MRTSKLLHCWLQVENNLCRCCYKGGKSEVRYRSSRVSFPGDCLQEGKPRYCVHKCFDKPDWSLAKPTDFIYIYDINTYIYFDVCISFRANFYWMSNNTTVLLSLLVTLPCIDGMLAADWWPQTAVKRPSGGRACRTVGDVATSVLDCNAIDLIGMAHL